MSIDWSKVNNFTPEEFDDPAYPGSWVHMAAETIFLLDSLRYQTGWKIITQNKHGVRGCVCMEARGHAERSRHYIAHPDGASAVDFRFDTSKPTRDQAMAVLQSGFPGIGIYYDWKSADIGFHVDLRSQAQIWVRKGGKYVYLLR
jgi:hypothetical protein